MKGRLRRTTWQTEHGQKRSQVEIVDNTFDSANSKTNGELRASTLMSRPMTMNRAFPFNP